MDTNLYNTKLSSSHPLAFIEQKTSIDSKNFGSLAVISFGALERNSHLAPEFGGVAVVHEDPDVVIAIKYIPWNAKKREIEHKLMVEHITNNTEQGRKDYAHSLSDSGYTLPAMKERWRREYAEELAEKTKENARNIGKKKKVKKMVKKVIQTHDGEEIIPLDE